MITFQNEFTNITLYSYDESGFAIPGVAVKGEQILLEAGIGEASSAAYFEMQLMMAAMTVFYMLASYVSLRFLAARARFLVRWR